VLYYLGLWFLVTGGFLAARSLVALAVQVNEGYGDSPALFIVQGMFAASMYMFGFFLRHRELFDTVTPAPSPESDATPPRRKRPARSPGRP
jgi:hypothetical protein